MVLRKITEKITLAAAADVVGRLKMFVFIPIISKLLGAYAYGIWVQMTVAVGLLGSLTMLGMNYGFLRFLPGMNGRRIAEEIPPVIGMVFAASLAGAAVLILASGPISLFLLKDPASAGFIRLSGFYLVTVTLRDLFVIYFRARENIRLYARIVFIDALISVMIAFVAAGRGLYALLLGLVISNGVIILVSLLAMSKDVMFRFSGMIAPRAWIRYSLPFVPIALLLWVSNSIDRYFIGHIHGVTDVAVYSVPYAFSYFVLNFFISPLYIVFQPVITRLWNTGMREKAVGLLDWTVKACLAVMVPVAAIFAALSGPVIGMISTADFVRGAVIIPFIAAGYIFYLTGVFVEIVFFVRNAGGTLAGIYLAAALLNVLGNILLVPSFGIVGAALATMASFAAQFLMTCRVVRADYRIGIGAGAFFKIIICSAMVFLLIMCLPHATVQTAILAGFAGMASYGALLFLLKVYTRRDIDVVRELLA